MLSVIEFPVPGQRSWRTPVDEVVTVRTGQRLMPEAVKPQHSIPLYTPNGDSKACGPVHGDGP